MKKIVVGIFFINFIFCNGKYGDAFLGLGTSARDIGIGQAVVADLGNPSGFNVCPASIGGIHNKVIYLLLINQYGLAEYFSAGIVIPLRRNHFIGVNTSGFMIDNLQYRPDLSGLKSLEARRDSIRSLLNNGFESFNDLEFAATITFAKMNQGSFSPLLLNPIIYKLPIGINIRLIRKNLYELESSGIGFDIGAMLSLPMSDLFSYKWLGTLSFGLSINHAFGTHLFWNNDKQDIIPMQLITGINIRQPIQKIHSHISILVQQNNLYPDDRQFGFELTSFQRLSLRMGYENETMQGGIGFLAKINKIPIRIDYSFSDHILGSAHRLGLQFKF